MSTQSEDDTLKLGLLTVEPPILKGMSRPVEMLLRRFLTGWQIGTLTIRMPNGSGILVGNPATGPAATIILNRWRAAWRILAGGDMGFADAYLDGDWSTPDLAMLMYLGACNQDTATATAERWWPLRMADRAQHFMRRNSRSGSRRNIEFHYDLGNEFYAQWLDPGMTYSSALFTPDATTLEAAQAAKYRRITELLRPEPGHKILEIGCGWGEMSRRLAGDHGCDVKALTLSQRQQDVANQRLAAAGLTDRAEIALTDYRDSTGAYDRIVSLEMIEAVGEAFWPTYFQTIFDRLKPGGVAVLQAITIAEERFATYRLRPDFIQRHVFPGGMLMTPSLIAAHAKRAGLALTHQECFAESYAKTLSIWADRFAVSWPEIRRMGFDDRFKRMWNYYLRYCEAGFRHGAIDVGFYRLERI